MDIKKIEFDDINYPEFLKSIKKPPKKLYILGNTKLLEAKKIAVVGSRNCSKNGAELAYKFARELSSVGICVVSGLAKGIDTNAHIGAMKERGKTIAVLGCGLNNVFPKENEKLFYDIINNGGAVISEYEPDEDVESFKFVQRNRIVSGMSMGVLVVEAAINSGSCITARDARDEKKTVFAIPHNIDEKLGKGTNRLLKLGAKCVVETQDILDEFECFKDIKSVNIKEQKDEPLVIPEQYLPIYRCIKDNRCNVNTICKKINKSITEVNSLITLMELDGIVKRLARKHY